MSGALLPPAPASFFLSFWILFSVGEFQDGDTGLILGWFLVSFLKFPPVFDAPVAGPDPFRMDAKKAVWEEQG